MTDDLDRLSAALKANPEADVAARRRAIGLAMENFDRAQASSGDLRSNPDRPNAAGFWNKVKDMLASFSTRPVLAATTSVAALCVGLAVLLPQMGSLTGPETLPPPAPLQAPAEAVSTSGGQVAPAPKPLAKAADQVATADAQSEEAPAMRAAAAPPMEAAAPLFDAMQNPAVATTEAYANAPANPVKVTVEEPVSTLSADVDTASYAIVRSMLNSGQFPPPDAVRAEEFVNYFPYDYPVPTAQDAPFRANVSAMPTPWNSQTRLVRIGVQAGLPIPAQRPAMNLVLLIDTSGSMDEPNKLPLLKQSLALMLPELSARDQVAIVAYAGSAGEVLPPTAATDRATILSALDRLAAGGSTAGAEGLALAYQLAAQMSADGEVNRVLLATDGDFNVGIADPEALKSLIAHERQSGSYLSVLGFGRGNLDDATMQALAQNGNGTASYIDTLSEAHKVLVDQLAGTLLPVADDVKIQVEWNPAQVAEYRLIGYETRALRREDFKNDRVDAGEIGAGHQMTALYEITAPGSAALRNDPLRYGKADLPQIGGELGFLRIRYKLPGEPASKLIETAILPETTPGDNDARFAAAVAGFAQLLSGSTYLNGWGWDEAIALAQGARGDDPFGYRAEAIGLMRLGKALAP